MENELFDKVLTVGPDRGGKGGMAAVMNIYSRHIEPFHFLPTNSARGKVYGYLNFFFTLLRLPVERIRGRKVLHIHFAGGKSLIRKNLVLRLGKFLGFKTVMHCHCNIIKTAKEKGKDSLAHILSKSDQVVVLADIYREFCENELGIEKVSVLNNPIEAHGIDNPEVDGPITFLFLGLIRKEKGIFDLLAAARNIKDKGYNFRIIVGGKGDMVTFYRMVDEYGIADCIDYRGWMDDKEKQRAMKQSHVLILPSYSEGMPMVVLEALAAGKPTIASAVGAVPDLLSTGGGTVIEAGNIDSLAQAMEKYIVKPSLIGAHGVLALKQSINFTPEAVVAYLYDIYYSLL